MIQWQPFVSSGGAYVAVVTQDSKVCWRRNDWAQCDIPANSDDVVAVSCGAFHSAVVGREGRLVCWGLNDEGQCCVPDAMCGSTSVSCGWHHTAAVTHAGKVVCWGACFCGQNVFPVDWNTVAG
jgi:alpha-tubulin suppressor-like RCC1 family protein